MTDVNREIENVFGGIAGQYHRLRRRIEKLERTPADLRNAAIDGGKGLLVKSENETVRLGDNGIEHQGGPVPFPPAPPFVDAGGEAIKIQHSGLDIYENIAPRDFRRAQVHVSQDEDFEPSLSTLAGFIDAPNGGMTHRLPGGEWYVGVVWETRSGKLSDLSETVLADVEPLVDADEIQEALDQAQERIDEAAAEAQERIDELEEKLGDVAGFDPSEIEQELSEISDGLNEARQDAANMFEQFEGEIAPQALIDKLLAQEAWIGGALLKDGAVEAEHITASESLSAKIGEFLKLSVVDLVAGTGQIDEGVITKLWSDVVVANMVTAEEAFIGGALIKDNTIDVAKLNVTEELTAAVAQFLRVKADMLEANAVDADAIAAGAIEADHLNGRIIKGEHIQGDTFSGESFEGGTFTGSTFQTDSANKVGVKFDDTGIHGWDDNGEQIVRITGRTSDDPADRTTGNMLSGRFYTNGEDQPGIIMNPDYGPDSKQGPGIWFSESGGVGFEEPAIWIDKREDQFGYRSYNMIIRGKQMSSGRSRIEVQGGLHLTQGGIQVDTGTVDANYGAFGRLEASSRADFYATTYFNSEIVNSGVTTASATANVNMTSTGRIRKTSSVRRSKVNIESVDETHPERILDLYPRIWLDRAELQDALEDKYSDYVWPGNQYSGPTADEDAIRDHLGALPRRIPGLIAEEVVEAGLTEYATYDRDSETGEDELSGIAYDRLWTLLIPLVREQREKIKSQGERISDLETRLARLEAMMK